MWTTCSTSATTPAQNVSVNLDAFTGILAHRLAAVVPAGFYVKAADGMLRYTCDEGRFPGQQGNYDCGEVGVLVRDNFGLHGETDCLLDRRVVERQSDLAIPPGGLGLVDQLLGGRRVVLRRKKIRCERSCRLRGRQDAGSQMRPGRPVRLAVRCAEGGWIAGQRDKDRHHRGRIHPMVHRAVPAVMRRAARWAKSSLGVSLGRASSGRGRNSPSFAAKGNGDKR